MHHSSSLPPQKVSLASPPIVKLVPRLWILYPCQYPLQGPALNSGTAGGQSLCGLAPKYAPRRRAIQASQVAGKSRRPFNRESHAVAWIKLPANVSLFCQKIARVALRPDSLPLLDVQVPRYLHPTGPLLSNPNWLTPGTTLVSCEHVARCYGRHFKSIIGSTMRRTGQHAHVPGSYSVARVCRCEVPRSQQAWLSCREMELSSTSLISPACLLARPTPRNNTATCLSSISLGLDSTEARLAHRQQLRPASCSECLASTSTLGALSDPRPKASMNQPTQDLRCRLGKASRLDHQR